MRAMRQGTAWRIVIGLALLATGTPLAVRPAQAEGGFFDFLFGKSAEQPPGTQRPRVAPARESRVRPRAPAPARPQTTRRSQPTIVTKPDFVVAVFGDVFAVSVARGLGDTESPGETRQVLERSDETVGLDATEAAAWNRVVASAQAQAGRMDAAVMLLGSNDGNPLTDAQGQKLAPPSAGWRQLYGDRVAALADQFRDKHVPLIWMGLPIVRDQAKARLYAAINEVVQDRATREGAIFVDTWQPFTDENGDFSTTGPDVDGRQATLRWTNGWNFTRAGAKKLASFLVPEFARLRDRARSAKELATVSTQNSDAFDQALQIDVNAQILREAGLPVPGVLPQAAKQPGPVLALTAAPSTNGGALASVQPVSAADPPSARHSGRADDFAWPPR